MSLLISFGSKRFVDEIIQNLVSENSVLWLNWHLSIVNWSLSLKIKIHISILIISRANGLLKQIKNTFVDSSFSSSFRYPLGQLLLILSDNMLCYSSNFTCLMWGNRAVRRELMTKKFVSNEENSRKRTVSINVHSIGAGPKLLFPQMLFCFFFFRLIFSSRVFILIRSAVEHFKKISGKILFWYLLFWRLKIRGRFWKKEIGSFKHEIGNTLNSDRIQRLSNSTQYCLREKSFFDWI